MSEVLFTVENQIGKIILNRPEAFNSVNKALAEQLLSALDQCERNDEVRAIVVTGSGKAFCAGQDLKEVTTEATNPGFENLLEERYEPVVKKLRGIEKPIIGAINGVAAGAGANFALACDIIVASTNASFIQAFSGIGLIPDSGGTFTLPRAIGFAKASALAMLGDKISAEEAEKLGMIYQCIPAEEFESYIEQLADRLAKMPTKGLGLTKRALNASANNTLKEQLILERNLQIEAANTEDYQEGVQAFVEKRKPNFKGK